jgi:hypothetical protein
MNTQSDRAVTACGGHFSITNHMGENSSWEANSRSASQEIPRFYGTRRFITVFTRARKTSRRPWGAFRNITFYGGKLLAPVQSPSWRTTHFRLSTTAYSIYPQLLSISGGILCHQIFKNNFLYFNLLTNMKISKLSEKEA